jgi:chromate transporter
MRNETFAATAVGSQAMRASSVPRNSPSHSPLEVLWAFLKLGLTSVGGPIAHLAYFRQEFVIRRRWLDDATYTDLVGLCQFLPGPASSQTGFSIGLLRAGYLGGVAAWTGFTLPSATALVLFAYGASALTGSSGAGLLHGLKIVAVAIVAQAVLGMARTLSPDRTRASIATVAALLMLLLGASWVSQIGAILIGALAGLWLCRTPTTASTGTLTAPIGRSTGIACLIAFATLLIGLPLLEKVTHSFGVALFNAFYRSGALVFGGGHVVLPLLRDAVVVPGWVSEDRFLAGYGAVQPVPGPLFTFAGYLGAIATPAPHRVLGAILALIGIFLPGLLILLGTLPFWNTLRTRASSQAAMRGINAAVVGLLGAALYSPVWTSSVKTPRDFSLALLGFVLLTAFEAPPLIVVVIGAAGGILIGASRSCFLQFAE